MGTTLPPPLCSCALPASFHPRHPRLRGSICTSGYQSQASVLPNLSRLTTLIGTATIEYEVSRCHFRFTRVQGDHRLGRSVVLNHIHVTPDLSESLNSNRQTKLESVEGWHFFGCFPAFCNRPCCVQRTTGACSQLSAAGLIVQKSSHRRQIVATVRYRALVRDISDLATWRSATK